MTDQMDLSQKHHRILQALIMEHIPNVEVWAYSSRVNGQSHAGSDLDLALRAPGLEMIPVERLADFTDAVYESTIPFLVEVRDWIQLPASFHREIERNYVPLYIPADA